MKNILSLISLVLSVHSCSKDEFIIQYPTTYTSTKFSGQNIRVYTRNGEIKDSKIISKLTKKVKQYFTDLDTTKIENELSVTYLSPSSLELTSLSSKYKDTLNLHETPEITYWENRFISYAVVGDGYKSYDFKGKHLKYQPLFKEDFTPSPLTGYNNAVKFKECNYVKDNGKVLLMPFVDHYFIRYDEFKETFLFWQAAKRANNSFDSQSFSKLGVRDTLVIQVFNVELNIKNKR